MKENVLLLEEEKEKWTPKVITGGKGPPTGENWLVDLPEKTTVLIQRVNDQNFALGQATVMMKLGRAILLAVVGEGKSLIWVDPVKFCNHYRRYEILQTAEEAELEENVNRTNTNPKVADVKETKPVREVRQDL